MYSCLSYHGAFAYIQIDTDIFRMLNGTHIRHIMMHYLSGFLNYHICTIYDIISLYLIE